MKRIVVFAYIAIALISVAVRLYRINGPIADWHSFRQTDTASVARIYSQRGIDLLHPRYQDLSNIQSGKDNPEGFRMVEFPLYQGIAAMGFRMIPVFPIEYYLRFITILATAATGIVLGVMIGRRTTTLSGLLTAFLYAVLPFSVFYGRAILPDPFMVFFAVLSLYFLDTEEAPGGMRIMISGICAGCAVLVKPFAVLLLAPMVPLLLFRVRSLSAVLKVLLWLLLAILPFIGWRMWIRGYPEGIAASDWLLNGNNIRFKGAWFYWLFADRIGRLILGYWGLILFGAGCIWKTKKQDLFLPFLFAGSLCYLIIVASGNVQHDYYQILLLPVITAFSGMGLAQLFRNDDPRQNRWVSVGLGVISLMFALSFSWYTIRSYYWINRPDIIEAGSAADAILPKDAKVIAPYNGDTTFLYQTKRVGWPIGFDIDHKISLGATHYVTVSPTDADLETKELAEKYTVLVRNEKYAIIDLTQIKQ